MNNFELIEQYLTNKLEGQEKAAFEEQLKNDPALKGEVQTQEGIIRGIQKARAAELKTMLNNVPIAAPSFTLFNPSTLRIAASVVGAGALITALYFYYQPDGVITGPKMSTSIEDSVQGKALIDSSAKEETSEIKPQSIETEKEEVKQKESVRSKKTVPATSEVKQPKIELIDPSKDMAEQNSEASTAVPAKITIEPSKISVETISSDKRHSFHYQFVQGKLVLFGSFDKEPYEVIEINGDNQSHFLYYKSTFYLLDQKQSKITRLEPITDSSLIKKLSQYKGQ